MFNVHSGFYLGQRKWRVAFFSLLILLLAGCGGGGGGSSSPTLTSISIPPVTTAIPLGTSHQFTATGNYSDSSTQDLTSSVTWSSSNLAVATITTSGLAASVTQGTTTIHAESGLISGSATLTVDPPALVSIAVSPLNPILNFHGATQQFIATGTYTDKSTQELTTAVSWSSSNNTVATISPSGFATAVAITGSTTIGAAVGNITNTTTLTVRTATVSGQISFPDSDMDWKPNLYDYATYAGAKVRVQGTNIVVDVLPNGPTTGTFTIPGVPWGDVSLIFEEGTYYDVFTLASKRATVNATATTVSGVNFNFVYHWAELAGYPPPWGTLTSQGVGIPWHADFVSDQVAFILFRVDATPERIELYRTLDRGTHWSMIGQWEFDQTLWNTGTWAYPATWLSFHFTDADHGLVLATNFCIPFGACGSGFFVTGDGGQHWTPTGLPIPPASGYSISWSNQVLFARTSTNHLIAAGTIGGGVQGYSGPWADAIWESDNQGATWAMSWYASHSYDEGGGFVGLDANADGRAVAFHGWLNQEFVLRDAQGNWVTHPNGGIHNQSGRDLAMVGDTAWIMSIGGTVPNGTYRSLDAGLTWEQMSGGLLQDFDFATAQKGFAQGGGPAYVTYDAGASWKYQAAGGAVWPGTMDIWAFDRTHAAWAEGGFGDPNQKAQLFTYVEPTQANLEMMALGSLADATITAGTNSVLMASYQLINQGPLPITVNSLTLHASGTGQDFTDVTAVMLWWDKNANGAVDPGDTLLATSTYDANDGGVNLVVGSAYTLQQFMPMNLLVTYDFSPAIMAAKTYRLSLRMVDVSAQTDTASVVVPTAPTGFVLTSRTVTVSP